VDNIRIVGGTPLQGTVRISGAKNAALPILCAALLADGEHTFRAVPDLRDIHTTIALLERAWGKLQLPLLWLALRRRIRLLLGRGAGM